MPLHLLAQGLLNHLLEEDYLHVYPNLDILNCSNSQIIYQIVPSRETMFYCLFGFVQPLTSP